MNRYTSLRACLSMIPERLQESVFQRWLRVLLPRCPGIYQNAPLRHAATTLMDLHPGDVGHGMIAAYGYYELPLTRMIKNIALREGGMLLDVGANYGYFSLLWTALRPDNSAEAIEASPRNLVALTRNIEKNGLARRINLHALAAGNHAGATQFDMGPDEQTGWGGITQNADTTAVTVPLQRMDQLFADRSFSVLKIDCEGADAWVLEGAELLLRDRKIKHIFMEENFVRQEQLGIPARTAVSMLERMGYRCEEISGSRASTLDYHAWLP